MHIRAITADAARPIRREVLKPGLPDAEVIFDGDDDPAAVHLGVFDGEALVGIASFLVQACPLGGSTPAWRLRGMATRASVRNRGVGGALLKAGLARLRRAGAAQVWCHGRTRARGFYERHGFEAVGEEFESPHTGPHYLFVLRLIGDAQP